MKIWIENDEKKIIVKGTMEFLEGEFNKDKQPTFFILGINSEGKEFKIFFKSKNSDEHKLFIKDICEVFRH